MKKIHTHYDNLKVARDAPASVIRAAYRTLSQEHHPDRSSHPDAVRIMTAINVSYAVLSDASKRRIHDDWIAKQEEMAARSPADEPRAGARPRRATEPDTGATPPHAGTSPPPRPEAPPDASFRDLPRGIRAVPARLWILAAIVLTYATWLTWSRLVVENVQRVQATAQASDAPGRVTAAGSEPATPAPASSESMSVQGRSVYGQSRSPGRRERERPRKDETPADRRHDSAAAAGPAGEPTAPELPEQQQRTAADAADRLVQAAETGNNDSSMESTLSGSAKAQEVSGVPDRAASSTSGRIVLQVAALSSVEKAAELQAKLHAAGLFTHTIKRGELIIVRIGPLSKDEADKVRAKLGRIGLSGFSVPV